jgi:hypothetical protein
MGLQTYADCDSVRIGVAVNLKALQRQAEGPSHVRLRILDGRDSEVISEGSTASAIDPIMMLRTMQCLATEPAAEPAP